MNFLKSYVKFCGKINEEVFQKQIIPENKKMKRYHEIEQN